MFPFEAQLRTRLVFGAGSLAQLGKLAASLGFRRTLIAADHGIVRTGYADRARALLEEAGIDIIVFDNFDANPDGEMIERGRTSASAHRADSIIGLGGGSSMDCAKGINFVLTNGGRMEDYAGYGKPTRPLLPMIGVPTTAGTGSEAQSYALISDRETHRKMACGAPDAAFRIAILDPELTLSAPHAVRATAGYDAISHAVETWVTTKRNAFSECFSREAWRLLAGNFERTLGTSGDIEAAGAMQLGAHWAGIAIEHSMLGATHACANPLTKNFGTTHGVALAALLPAVVRWNSSVVKERYAELDHGDLEGRLAEFARIAGLSVALRDLGVHLDDLPGLAGEAAEQWTGRFNPRPFDRAGAMEIYECAW